MLTHRASCGFICCVSCGFTVRRESRNHLVDLVNHSFHADFELISELSHHSGSSERAHCCQLIAPTPHYKLVPLGDARALPGTAMSSLRWTSKAGTTQKFAISDLYPGLDPPAASGRSVCAVARVISPRGRNATEAVVASFVSLALITCANLIIGRHHLRRPRHHVSPARDW